MYYGLGTDLTSTRHPLSTRNNIMATTLKVLCHIKNLTLSVDTYWLEEQPSQISFQSDDGALGILKMVAPTARRTKTKR